MASTPEERVLKCADEPMFSLVEEGRITDWIRMHALVWRLPYWSNWNLTARKVCMISVRYYSVEWNSVWNVHPEITKYVCQTIQPALKHQTILRFANFDWFCSVHFFCGTSPQVDRWLSKLLITKHVKLLCISILLHVDKIIIIIIITKFQRCIFGRKVWHWNFWKL